MVSSGKTGTRKKGKSAQDKLLLSIEKSTFEGVVRVIVDLLEELLLHAKLLELLHEGGKVDLTGLLDSLDLLGELLVLKVQVNSTSDTALAGDLLGLGQVLDGLLEVGVLCDDDVLVTKAVFCEGGVHVALVHAREGLENSRHCGKCLRTSSCAYVYQQKNDYRRERIRPLQRAVVRGKLSYY